MLVQLDRRERRPFTATATELPLGPATATAPPVVAVLSRPGRVTGLPAHLPAGWTVRIARDLDDVRPNEIMLFGDADVAAIHNARAVLPRRTRIVALVDPDAPAERVAGVSPSARMPASAVGSRPFLPATWLPAVAGSSPNAGPRLSLPDAVPPFARSWSCGWHDSLRKRHKGNHNSKIAEERGEGWWKSRDERDQEFDDGE